MTVVEKRGHYLNVPILIPLGTTHVHLDMMLESDVMVTIILIILAPDDEPTHEILIQLQCVLTTSCVYFVLTMATDMV